MSTFFCRSKYSIDNLFGDLILCRISGFTKYFFVDCQSATEYQTFLVDRKKISPLISKLSEISAVYQASMSRQFAADLPPDIEQTALKDEPKDWFIKTADFGDTHDRVLQHRDGEYTQLLEDIAQYHHILQREDCDRLITLQPPEYSGYKTQIVAAMQCLGYSPKQFHFIPVRPLKLYAFHRDSNKVQPIPDLPLSELQKVVNLETIQWYSLRVPLEEVAPLNISTSSPEYPQNHFYRIQLAYAYTQKYLNFLGDRNAEIPSETSSPNPQEQNLIQTLDTTESIVDRAIDEVAPHLICQHVEQIAEQCLQWLPPQQWQWQATSHTTLERVRNAIADLVETKLGLTLVPTDETQS